MKPLKDLFTKYALGGAAGLVLLVVYDTIVLKADAERAEVRAHCLTKK